MIDFRQHFDRDGCVIEPDEQSSRDLLEALEAAPTSAKSAAVQMLEGGLRGMVARWGDRDA